MTIFDLHKICACCHDNRLGDDHCILKLECEYYNSLTAEQKLQLSTPSYKVHKDKEQKSATSPLLVDPALVKVVGEAMPVLLFRSWQLRRNRPLLRSPAERNLKLLQQVMTGVGWQIEREIFNT